MCAFQHTLTPIPIYQTCMHQTNPNLNPNKKCTRNCENLNPISDSVTKVKMSPTFLRLNTTNIQSI